MNEMVGREMPFFLPGSGRKMTVHIIKEGERKRQRETPILLSELFIIYR